VPLMVLAGLAVIGGILGFPEFWGMNNWISEYLSPVIYRKNPSTLTHETEWTLMGIAVLAAVASIYTAYNVYRKNNVLPAAKEENMAGFERFVYHKYKVDEFYEAIITKPLNAISSAFYKFFDLQVVDGIVNGIGTGVKSLSSVVRRLQTGNIGVYIFAMVLCIIVILYAGLK
ncbi:MAG: NADH-quinone oxidoreductase subunit L, partial [Bacteroidia bacterium]